MTVTAVDALGVDFRLSNPTLPEGTRQVPEAAGQPRGLLGLPLDLLMSVLCLVTQGWGLPFISLLGF